MTRYTDEEVTRARDALADAMEDQVWERKSGLLPLVFVEARKGDSSVVPFIAVSVRNALLMGSTLTPIQRGWAVDVMDALINDERAARAVTSGPRKGAPKGGKKAIIAAHGVLSTIVYRENVYTVDEACDLVAETYHIEPNTVRKYWARHKQIICGLFAHDLKIESSAECDAAIQRILVARRRLK